MSGNDSRRVSPLWWVLAALVGLMVFCLAFVGWVYLDRAGAGGPLDRTEALRSDEPAAADVRTDLRQRATSFVEEFFTYGPDDLDDEGRLTGFSERVGPLMSAKFRAVLDQRQLQIEGVVGQYSVRSVGEVQGVGVVSFDDDSAEVLVGGWGAQAYPNPEKPEEEVKGDQLPFRFQVSLVKVDGEWLVDNLDSFDDEHEGLADEPSDAPTTDEPTSPASPSDPTTSGSDATDQPDDDATGEGAE